MKRKRGWGNRFIQIYQIEPELLWGLYWGEGLSCTKIAKLFGCDRSNIRLKMIEYNIPRKDGFENHTKVRIKKDELYDL